MKRFLFYVLGLCFIAAAFAAMNDALVLKMMTSSAGNSAYKMRRLFAPAVENEIPILGSSRAKENYVPSMISADCFDYGENGQEFAETLFHLKHVLRADGRKTVIVNLDPWGPGRGDSPFRCDYRFAENVPVDPLMAKCAWVERVPGFRFAGQLRSSFATWMNERAGATRVVDKGAMLLQYERTEAEIEKVEAVLPERYFECSSGMRDELRKLLSDRTLRKTIIWVVSPVSAGWERHFKGQKELSDFLSWLSAFPCCRVIDARYGSVCLTSRDFKDSTHLNYSGARKFTRYLVEKLNFR